MVLGAAVILLAGIVADRLWLEPPESARETRALRSQIDLGAERPLRSPWPRDDFSRNHPFRTELALSPDGALLVWTSRPDDDPAASALYLRRLETGEVTRLAGTQGASQPFFSPDGRWIGFSADGRLVGAGRQDLRGLRERGDSLGFGRGWPSG